MLHGLLFKATLWSILGLKGIQGFRMGCRLLRVYDDIRDMRDWGCRVSTSAQPEFVGLHDLATRHLLIHTFFFHIHIYA